MSKVQDFLKLNGLDYKVNKTPVKTDINGHIQTLQDRFVTYKESNFSQKQLFSTVSSQYSIIQNEELLEFLEPLLEDNTLELTKSFVYGNGAEVFIQAKLPDSIQLINGDDIQKYITIINSFNGSSNSKVIISPIRLVCKNQLSMFKHTDKNSLTLRHSISYKDKLLQAEQLLELTSNVFKHIESELNNLIDIPISNVEDKIKKVIYSSEEVKDMRLGTVKISTQKTNIVNGILDFYYNGIGQNNIQGTAYGVVNAVSGYYSHRDTEFKSLIVGSKAQLIQNTYNLVK